jgi:hypothetical protein
MDDDTAPPADMVIIGWFDEPEDAHRAASALVENGVGAVLDQNSPRTGLAVLTSDSGRARQVLGLAEPKTVADELELKATNRSLLVPVLICCVAMVVVPLVAFFVSFKLAGG